MRGDRRVRNYCKINIASNNGVTLCCHMIFSVSIVIEIEQARLIRHPLNNRYSIRSYNRALSIHESKTKQRQRFFSGTIANDRTFFVLASTSRDNVVYQSSNPRKRKKMTHLNRSVQGRQNSVVEKNKIKKTTSRNSCRNENREDDKCADKSNRILCCQ